MAFNPRQFTQILDDMIDFVKGNSDFTDFSVGSGVRTILEAAALEDDEQYFQMTQLLDAFSTRTATGTLLDGRMQDYNVRRLQPTSAITKIVINDEGLITDSLAFDVVSGVTTIELEDSTKFPTTGFPYTVRIGEGTLAVEDVTVTANNTSIGILTVSALSSSHETGARVSFVSGAADVTIPAGIQVQAPAIANGSPIVFVNIERGTIVNGNYKSTPMTARALLPGPDGNVGPGRITQFTSNKPFAKASVTNITKASGGLAVEKDSSFRDRGVSKLQSLSNATLSALKSKSLAVTDPVTGRKVSTVSVVEDHNLEEVVVYIDDGTGLVPEQVSLARDSVNGITLAGSAAITVSDSTDFPGEGYIILSPENSSQTELVKYNSVTRGSHTLVLASVTSQDHDDGDEVALVDVLTTSSEANKKHYRLKKFPLVRSSVKVWVQPVGGSPELWAEGTDYLLDKGRGEIQFISSLPTGSSIAVGYSYYTGLVFYTQKILNGSRTEETTFPGVVSGGIKVVVETPLIRRVSVRMTVVPEVGYDDFVVAGLVQSAVENYIASRGIGGDVIISEIIDRAMDISGVANVLMQTPTQDVAVADTELPVPFSASGASLVVVL